MNAPHAAPLAATSLNRRAMEPFWLRSGAPTLDVYRDLDLFARVRRLAPIWEQAAHRLAGAPHVIDVRNIGLLAAIELKPRDGAAGARGAA
jgi:beta-alanine--pyruvate transaminase